ncbi:MICAL-like protein 1 [Rhipicephalus sanguineus]|uniref:MICAL-like protein 1 n=1 Tax=Rhipicephalus sanguineus TaxID=34632 RepID=UPI00189573FC|nr:MICAL-like protein 1 [Rhipicephalus sanguineus]
MAPTEKDAPFRAVVLETPMPPSPAPSEDRTQRQHLRDFPPLQPRRPLRTKGEVPPTPVLGPAQDQNPQDATPHPTPAASPVSPDPASASTADDQRICWADRRRRQRDVDISHAASSSSANPPTIEESPSTDDSVTSNASHAASSSSANPPTIEESSSTADGTVHIEDSDSSSSETPLRIDEDATPSDVSRESVTF